jgi:DNA-binding transcriptional LysR family regulator
MLDLKRLRVLREVAERGSFSAAADSLYVSQSAISQQISALEAEVGTPLLLRLRSGPVLTDAGKLLVSHGDAAICRLEQAERELAELSGMGAGELRLVSFSSASATVVAAAAQRFSKLHPEVRLSLSEAEPEESLDRIKRGEFDVALAFDFELYPFTADRDLVFTHLLDEHMHVAVPPNHPLAGRSSLRLEELASDPWLCGSSETSCRQLTLRSCEQAGFTPDVAYESNDYTVMLALVAAGMGVTLVPDLALLIPSPEVPMIAIEPQPPIRRVWALTLEAGSRSGATDAMLEVLGEVSAEIIPAARQALAA